MHKLHRSFRQWHRSAVRRIGALLALTGLLALATPGAAGSPEDPIVTALEQALRAYRGHDVGAAQGWTAVAASLLDQSVATRPSDKWILGNTAQLLPLLDLYGQIAAGHDPARDRDVDQIVTWLQQVDTINRGPLHPVECGGVAVDYDPFSHLVRRIGDVAVDYSPFTQQIRRVATFSIDYNPFTGRPRQIGPVAIDWDPFRPTVRAVAGVSLR